MIVTNISDQLITDKSREHWFDYWKHFSQNDQSYCSEYNCCNPSVHGVIVKISNQLQADSFIVPLCKPHSRNLKTQIELSNDAELIPSIYSL
ncbi:MULTISPECIES: hypothetical protein [Moritella]|uniref:Uncharacterized protein n=1 Tax=Moritella yayanosii TaxID=69539 RepID=A0A330LQU3_9GAMM|nr:MULTISPECIES: hypothetical protein [Moritella]NQZ48641.1 hypothetical protein [Moritella sp.]SQD79354.1 conserved protein of unknown function [Moritella yayanosii]